MGFTPLCPAGHLPHKGGDRHAAMSRRSRRLRTERRWCALPISPPVGEMPGRAEGGEPHPPT
ncbi:MAG TPA: lytic murein transglycosylase [Agrobacterium sp.]|nr:lytic murein transglycosylase [Agrobacterium sp.]